MIDDLKPYPEYKESGLPWVGNMPAHWSQRRTKFLFQERIQKGFPKEPLLAATQTRGVIRKEDYGSRTVTATKDLHLLKLVEKGDFVISLRSFEGGIEIAHCRGIISPAYTILTPRSDVEPSYYAKFFKSALFIKSLTLFVTGIREGQNIDYERVGRAYMPFPPKEEQELIGRFLGHLNRRVDQAIRSKRKLIALLNEQKQAIIQKAVTKGLDPNVPLKDSGVPWLGQIPAHWEMKRAKYLFHEVDERSLNGHEELLSVSHITGVTPRSQKTVTMFKAASYAGHKICRPGDLAVNTMWAWMGAMGVSLHTGIISPAYAVYRPKNPTDLLGSFVDGLLRSKVYVAEFLRRSTGVQSSRSRLYPEEFFRIPIVFPPAGEQRTIMSSIQDETGEIDKSITGLDREIDLLREYRTRLVFDVVTGKLDVREAAAKLPPDEDASGSVAEGEDPDELDDEVMEDAA